MKPKLSEYWIRILTSTLLICFCPHPAHGQEAVAKVDRFSILSSGSLTIWGTDMPDFMDDQPVQAALNKEFPRLKVNFRTFNRANFLPALASAKTDGNLPDALFVGNWLLAEPMMAQLSVVELMGQPRFQSRGWWFALEDAGHNARGEAFLPRIGGRAQLLRSRQCLRWLAPPIPVRRWTRTPIGLVLPLALAADMRIRSRMPQLTSCLVTGESLMRHCRLRQRRRAQCLV